MSKFLSEVKGFTPVIDILANELGLMAAVVYGIVWRYCQMEDKVCTASRERIAEHANISVKTVERHLKELCETGYLEDLTPEKRHRPHIYVDSGKAKIKGLLTAEVSKTESPSPGVGQTESLTRSDRESYLSKTESLIRRPSYDREYDTLSPNGGEKADPLSLTLERITEGAREKEGQWTIPQGKDGLISIAILSIYKLMESTPPKPDSGTWRALCDKLEPILADHSAKSGEAIEKALELFKEDSPKTFNPWYKPFPGQFGVYLGKVDNDGQLIIKLGM